MTSFSRLLEISKKYRGDYIWGTIYSALNKFCDVAPEILIGIAIDVVVSKKESFVARLGFSEPESQIYFLSFLTLLIWVGESLFEYLYSLKWKGLAQKIQHETRLDLYRHIQNLDLAFFEDRSSGSLVTVINDDVNQLERFLNGGANDIVQVVTAVILIGGVFFYLSPSIAVLAFLPMPLILFGAFFFQKKAEPLYADVRQKVADLAGRLTANISGMATIKAFTMESQEAANLERSSLLYSESNQKAIRVSSAFVPIIRMAVLMGFICTFVLGGIKTLHGELNVGLYGVLVFLTQRLLWPLTRLADTVDLYQRAMASVDRIMDVLKTPVRILAEGGLKVELDQKIEFQNVSFDYPQRPGILRNVSIAIEPGKTTAFVGATGSGKSTLVKLLLRFYEVNQGQILIGSHPIQDLDLQNLRAQIGWVSQDVFLFHGSLEENIRYGLKSDLGSRFQEVAKLTFVDEFAQSLPQKYQTLVGERGQKLSGGQRQRIALARAVLKDPKLLILDEATSSVDNETESLIQKSLELVAQGRTTVMIAHRLSTVVKADRIYVIDQGQVLESGTHDELLRRGQAYARLWRLQVRGNQGPPATASLEKSHV